MAARVFLLSILFTEVLRPACLAGVKGASGSVRGSNISKSGIFELEPRGLTIRLKIEPSGNLVVGRKGVRLKCPAGGNQTISWLRNGQAAPPCGVVSCSQPRKGVLHLHKIEQKPGVQTSAKDKIQTPDSYRCVLKTSIGLLRSAPVFVHIADLSREFNEPPRDVIVREGEVARLSCRIDSIPSANITWQRDRQLLSYVDKTKYFMVSPGVLYINATKLSDAGSYRCVASNKFVKNPRKVKETKLRVTKIEAEIPDVSISLFPQISYDYHLINGSDLMLVCASSGLRSLVTWTFISQSTDGAVTEQPRLLINSTNSIAVLTLKHVSAIDAGTYQCSVKSLGKIHQTQNVTVEVLVPPTFLRKPAGDSRLNGRNYKFECQAQGRPMPQIYWLKDSAGLNMNPRLRTYVEKNNQVDLSITATIPNDSGIYQCVAVNAAGEIWAAARLRVNSSSEITPVPTSIHCLTLSSDKILVSWELPKTVSAYKNYTHVTVHYAVVEPGSLEENSLTEPNSSSKQIEGLIPFTNYTMYVRMWIEGSITGISNQSASVQCSTASSVPIAAPVVTAEPISSTKLNVSWQPLTGKEARGYIVSYKLQWRLKYHPSSRVRYISSALSQYILTDLIPGKRYEVRVLASTEQGWPNVSDSQLTWIGVTMPSNDVDLFSLESLVDLDVINVEKSTVKVSWKFNGKTAKLKKNFDSWQLYYQNVAGKRSSSPLLPKNCTEYLFTELALVTEVEASYKIELCMITTGQPALCLSRQLDSTTLIDDLGPANLTGVPASPTSINVTWSAPPSDAVCCYEVCYNSVYNGDSASLGCFNTTDVSVTVRDLKPYTVYQLKVRTLYNTSEYRSSYSETIECYTNEDGEETNKLLRIDEKIPGPVRGVTCFLSNSTLGRVVWKQPGKLNGVIRKYTVSYTNGPSSKPLEDWANVTVLGNQTAANLPGLSPGTLYFVRVRAATNAGYGQSSEGIIRTGDVMKNTTRGPVHGTIPPTKPIPDQSLGIIIGVSISTCCIIICLSSIYCRKKWENTQSSRESSRSLKDRVILRNGNGCCVDRNSTSTSQHVVPAAPVVNDIELAVLCPPLPKANHSQAAHSNGIVEGCLKEPLLTPWDVNGDCKDLSITENTQRKPRSSTGSNQDLDGTQVSTLNYTAASSGSSLNNNLQRLESLTSLQQVPSTSVPVVDPNG